jgi:import inner membrane translocase subunit TIM13
MSWFFGGGNKDNNDKKGDPAPITDTFDHGSSSFGGSSSYGSDLSSGSGLGLGSSSSVGGGNFEQELMAEQQKAMIQAVMFKLTDTAFENCVTKPSSSLSSSEQSCIHATVGKYLEATELIVGRMQGGEQH